MNNKREATINVKLKTLFFKWLELLKPWHKLNNQQQKVLALLLYYHFKYKKEITNNKILWKIVFDYETRLKLIDDPIFEGKLNMQALNNILTILRKQNIVINNQISSIFIPELELNSKNFDLIFHFKITDNE